MGRKLPTGSSCYACDGEATSWEHAPPRGFYPEGKNRRTGKNYRDGLIVVPSCAVHNNEKSKDDLYSMTMIGTVAAAYAGAFGARQDRFTTSLQQRLHHGRRLSSTMTSAKDVTVAGRRMVALDPDGAAIWSVLEKLVRAIFYHERSFAEKWTDPCTVVCTHPAFAYESPTAHQTFLVDAARTLEARLISENEPLKGPHSNIFGYQLREPSLGKAVLRMVFYGTLGFIAFRLGASPTGTDNGHGK